MVTVTYALNFAFFFFIFKLCKINIYNKQRHRIIKICWCLLGSDNEKAERNDKLLDCN